MEFPTVDPKIEIIAYGPTLNIGDKILTPQEVIALAAHMTFKDKTAKEMAIEILESNQDFDKKTKAAIRESAGRGHASLTTSAVLWGIANDSSKFVDSIFTGARFGSALMPSGRRIPISEENIILPKSIAENKKAAERYIKTSQENIRLYEFLKSKETPVSKQEAAKIVHYGLFGGGFFTIPLETVLSYKQDFEINKDFIPIEGHSFVDGIEKELKRIGMDLLFYSRQESPRNTPGYPHPFTDLDKPSLIKHLQEKHGIPKQPIIDVVRILKDSDFIEELESLCEFQKEVFSNPKLIDKKWREIEKRKKDIIDRWNGAYLIDSFTNNSWRVWGEKKRHRTMPQQVESVYSAVERAIAIFTQYNNSLIKSGHLNEQLMEDIKDVFIIPRSIKEDKNLLKEWLYRFSDSLETFKELREYGIPDSDAIYIIPRGLMLNIHKRLDLYNLLDGYLPLRLCGTAEPEIRSTSELERHFIARHNQVHRAVMELLLPKCGTGICPERKPCGRINTFVPGYNKKLHEMLNENRFAEIDAKLN